jgi:exodeoxyribonuclease VII small subunit
MAEVEQILARFNTQQMDVDTLAAEVKRATELIAQCKERLLRAEREVAEVLDSNEEGTR